MPTTYTHWRFGNDALKTLPQKYQDIITKYRDEFNIGVQGPDALYYYNCIRPNEVNAYGYGLHHQQFRDIMETFKENAKKSDNYEACFAYLTGFLCHFTLDSYCHGYIERKKEVTGPSHNRMEAQFDRYLIEKDGYNPIKYYPSTKLNPVVSCCHNVASIYSMFPEETIQKALTDMVFYLRVIRDSNFIKRKLVSSLLESVGQSGYVDLMLGAKPDPECEVSNMRLEKLYLKAVEHFPMLFEGFKEFMENDVKLPPYFKHTFDQKENYKDIPILSKDDELKYEASIQD